MGVVIVDEVLSGMGPYWTEHLNRFGKFQVDMDKEVAEIEYRKNYREGRKEQLYKQYHEGGGRERAAERYRERKGGGDSKPPKAPPTLEEIEARKAKARAYSKEWYQRKTKGLAILVPTEFNNEGSGI